MADDVVGGLEQASPYEKAQAKYQEQIEKLAKIQENLMASLDTRQGAGNPLLALAQGFLAPTRGGGFGESAGNALQSMGAQQQLEEKQIKENAMMRMQLAQQSLAPYKEQMELARRASMSKDLRNILSGGDQSQRIDGPQAAQIARSAGIAPFSDEAASLVGRTMPAAGENIFSRIDPSTKGLLMSQASVDPEGVMKELATYGMKESGRTDKMKEMEYYANQFPGADRSRLMQFAASRQLIGDPSPLFASLKSVTEMIDQRIDVPTNKALKAFLLKQLEPYGMSQEVVTSKPDLTSSVAPKPVYGAAPEGFPRVTPSEQAQRDEGRMKILQRELAAEQEKLKSPNPDIRMRAQSNIDSLNYEMNQAKPRVSAAAPAKPAETLENLDKGQRELQQAQDIKRSELEIKRQAELEDTWSADNQRARDEIRDAKTVHETVGKYKDGFGLLSKPGSALAYAAQAGFRIGDKSVGVNDLEQALLRSGKYTQAEINAVSIVHQIALKWQLAAASAQKGAVSNYERTLFGQAGLNVSDDPKIIQYKAALIDAQAKNRQEVWELYQDYKKANKRANIDDFQRIPQFKELQQKFDSKLDRIRQSYSK